MKIADKEFKNGTHVMAIINLTPDSFFADSRANLDNLLFRVEKAVQDGAAVIDIGGQSTRPGHKPVNEEEEWSRLERPIDLIKRNFDVPLSVDTYYAKVAQNALLHGADMINDVWGLAYGEDSDGEMASVIAKHGASVCIMHNQNKISEDCNMWNDVFTFLSNSIKIAKNANVDDDRILIDGGVGFGKTKEQNHMLVDQYDRLDALGYPLLLGTSRKSMFGGEIKDRLAPTLETTRLATRKGVLFVRVHDVKENCIAIKEELRAMGRL